jgi:hypothetical protein
VGNYFFLVSLLLFSRLSPILVAVVVSVAPPVLVVVVRESVSPPLELVVPSLAITAVVVVVVVLSSPPLYSKGLTSDPVPPAPKLLLPSPPSSPHRY